MSIDHYGVSIRPINPGRVVPVPAARNAKPPPADCEKWFRIIKTTILQAKKDTFCKSNIVYLFSFTRRVDWSLFQVDTTYIAEVAHDLPMLGY